MSYVGDDSQDDTPTEKELFWGRIFTPINPSYITDNTPPANPVTTADRFLENAALAAHLGAEAEVIAEEIYDLDMDRDKHNRTIASIRRRILSTHFADIRASWGSEVVDAFVMSKTVGADWATLNQSYEALDTLAEKIGAKKKRLDTLHKRFKIQERVVDWSRQYVDYSKHQDKIQAGMR